MRGWLSAALLVAAGCSSLRLEVNAERPGLLNGRRFGGLTTFSAKLTNVSHRPIAITTGVLSLEVWCNGRRLIGNRGERLSYAGQSFGAQTQTLGAHESAQFPVANVELTKLGILYFPYIRRVSVGRWSELLSGISECRRIVGAGEVDTRRSALTAAYEQLGTLV